MSRTEADLLNHYAKIKKDEDTLIAERKSRSEDIVRLQQAIQRVAEHDFSGTEARTLDDLKAYDAACKQQLHDIHEAVDLLKAVIEYEHEDILNDVKLPLGTFDLFFQHAKGALEHVNFTDEKRERLSLLLQEIGKSYEGMVNAVLSYLEFELQYFKNLEVKKFEHEGTEYALQTYLHEREAMRQDIERKTAELKEQLDELQQLITIANDDAAERILPLATYFSTQFSSLIAFCMKRIDLSRQIIIEAILLQKEQYEQLDALSEQITRLRDAIIREQMRIAAEETPRWTVAETRERVEEFQKVEEKVKEEIAVVKEEIPPAVVVAKKEVLQVLQAESAQVPVVKRDLTALKATLARIMGVAAIAGAALTLFQASRASVLTRPAPDLKKPGIEWKAPQPASPIVPVSLPKTPVPVAASPVPIPAAPSPAPVQQPAAQEVLSHKFQLGDTTVTILDGGDRDSPYIYFNMHEDEQTARRAAEYTVDEVGGRILVLQSKGERLVTFSLNGRSYAFDPNRIFTDKGIESTLRKYSTYSYDAHQEIRKFVEQFREQLGLDKAKLIVSLHNNDAGYSALSYKGPMRGDASEVFIVPGLDPRDFFFVTDVRLYQSLRNSGMNVVLQSDSAKDDGSLSVYCAQNRIHYVNSEAGTGHIREQAAMLQTLQAIIANPGQDIGYVAPSAPNAPPVTVSAPNPANIAPYLNKVYVTAQDEGRYHFIVDGKTQHAYIIFRRAIVRQIPISTGRNGFGNIEGTLKTSPGLMEVRLFVGRGSPVGTAIKMGEIVRDNGKPLVVPIVKEPSSAGAFMTTRVIYLKGLERENATVEERGIRIHGTNKEGNLGQRDSHGCIRVSNADAIALADELLTPGSKVYVIPG
jgi:hypothetical protein